MFLSELQREEEAEIGRVSSPGRTSGLTCQVCGKIFSGKNQRQLLRRHSLIHTGEKPHACPNCPYRTNQKCNLNMHIATVHRAAPFLNPALPALPLAQSSAFHTSSSSAGVRVGVFGQGGCEGLEGRGLICPVCNKTFCSRNRRQDLQRHILSHTGERPFACSYCPYRATLKGNLKKHVYGLHAHLFTPMEKTVGSEVGRVAAWQSALVAPHSQMQTTSNFPSVGVCIKCQTCGKTFYGFNRKFLLKRHMITHTGEKPFHCPHCPHRANLKQNLEVHIKRKHKDQLAMGEMPAEAEAL
ncbi:hypothetical protein Pmani_018754 [Petrolisthes manimaculis]|uniref:C2H2-type domain-containing protein n=1 Tax=Petrolisthes manimaculis TaxID=1843537 RepID=A0AAE1PJS9_9EUCA|nr:hypothetical protein Pmani_018754 [Petrolisthes manimaculis]